MAEPNDFGNYDALKNIEYALTHLYNARDLLQKAKGWGWADIFGGGILMTVIKRNRIEEAQMELSEARKYINKMLSLLNSSSKFRTFDYDEGSFLRVSDFIFDNLITDIIVQKKINEISDQVDETIYKLEAIKQKLYRI